MALAVRSSVSAARPTKVRNLHGTRCLPTRAFLTYFATLGLSHLTALTYEARRLLSSGHWRRLLVIAAGTQSSSRDRNASGNILRRLDQYMAVSTILDITHSAVAIERPGECLSQVAPASRRTSVVVRADGFIGSSTNLVRARVRSSCGGPRKTLITCRDLHFCVHLVAYQNNYV